MFDYFGIPARRAVSFALKEAKDLCCPQIRTEHLLLGILRADKAIADRLNAGAEQAIRGELERQAPANRQLIPESTDLPLSEDALRALRSVIEWEEGSQPKTVEPADLVQALLRIEDCSAARLLAEHGFATS